MQECSHQGKWERKNFIKKNDGTNHYEQNKGLDENQDGTITKSEAAKSVIERRDTYFRYDDD